MTRRKQERFAELKTFPNCFENPQTMNGHWREDYFHNTHPIILELGCGRGAYTLGLARQYPEVNCIGIDIQGERLWYGAKEAMQCSLTNAAFIRGYVDHLPEYFSAKEVDEIWLTFPDPYPTKKQTKKRLTSPVFLEQYRHILKTDGVIHLKTDNKILFDYSIKIIRATHGQIINLHTPICYEQLPDHHPLHIATPYEQRYRAEGKAIYAVTFIYAQSSTLFST